MSEQLLRIGANAGKFHTGSVQSIRSKGVISGYQVRVDGGGRGKTAFYAARRLGGAAKALRTARTLLKELWLAKPKPRGGSRAGRMTKLSKSGAAGIRFVWSETEQPILRVFASWIDRKGRAHSTSYSVERNGLEVALDLAIVWRTSAGAPPPDKAALMKVLRRTYRTGSEA